MMRSESRPVAQCRIGAAYDQAQSEACSSCCADRSAVHACPAVSLRRDFALAGESKEFEQQRNSSSSSACSLLGSAAQPEQPSPLLMLEALAFQRSPLAYSPLLIASDGGGGDSR